MNDIRNELDKVIDDLEKKGITSDIDKQTRGLGDVVESVLTKFGITEQRYKEWFSLEECNCTRRKEWLNNFFSWQKKN
ncbi:MAG: hypothetical protein EBT07_17700 [Actinobacteria bacterium]|nr:hypothetical protein [Actinomycetota bacterium]